MNVERRIPGKDIFYQGNIESIYKHIPETIHGRGNFNLLLKPSIAIVGKRYPNKHALAFARITASTLANNNYNVVSGNAKGIDTEAHTSALVPNALGSEKTENTGTTTFVLPHGLQWFTKIRYPSVAEPLWDTHALVISQFKNTEQFTGGNAMTRNLLICMLSKAIIIIESDKEKVYKMEYGRYRSSETFATAKFAFEFGIPVFVVHPDKFKHEVPGNEKLIKIGATPIYHSNDIIEHLSKDTK